MAERIHFRFTGARGKSRILFQPGASSKIRYQSSRVEKTLTRNKWDVFHGLAKFRCIPGLFRMRSRYEQLKRGTSFSRLSNRIKRSPAAEQSVNFPDSLRQINQLRETPPRMVSPPRRRPMRSTDGI